MLFVDFELVLKTLGGEFKKNSIRYGIMGGFALGVLGVPRATIDIDFLVQLDDMDKVNQILGKLGYMRKFHTENVSHFSHINSPWGLIDIIHAFRKHSLKMLKRAKERPLHDGLTTVKVLQPEDVIGLKIQAIANDSKRTVHETADIESLLNFYRDKLDWNLIKEFYKLFDMDSEATRLMEKYGHAE